MSADHFEGWGAFTGAVFKRLEDGERVYHGASFQRPPGELAGEVEQEILDLAAWSFILWTRLRAIKAKLESEADHGSERRSTGT